MNPTFKTLALFVTLASLLTACTTPSAKAPAQVAKPNSPTPIAPKRGEPIDMLGLATYLEKEGTNLLCQGKLGTNLLRQVKRQTCSLKLPSPPTRALTSAELAQQTEMGVAVVGRFAKMGKAYRLQPTATGFFLTESGALATCRHVLDPKRIIGLVVLTRDGRVCPVREVLAVDTTNDVVILQVEGQGFTPLPVTPAVPPQGAPVWVLSHPEFQFYTLTAGMVSGCLTWPTPQGGKTTWLNITAEFANGSSGAPVFNECGAVVGVAKMTKTIYGQDGMGRAQVQMVTKSAIPSAALLDLIKSE